MHATIFAILAGALMLAGCGESGDGTPTPQQAAQLAKLRQATISQIEMNLKRPLSGDEKNCVVVKLDHGRLRSYITPPLSQTLEKMNPAPTPSKAEQAQIQALRAVSMSKPAGPGDWRKFLQEYSDELLRTSDLRITIPPEARESKWMGFKPASPEAIEAAEKRLGRKLPKSLREFYAVSNGWRATGYSIKDILPVESIGWLKDKDHDFYSLVSKTESTRGPFREDPDGSRLREYVLDQGTRVKRSLVISSWGDAAILLLDPGDHPHDGEWPAGMWASWTPGMEWEADSFGGLMQKELETFKLLRDKPKP